MILLSNQQARFYWESDAVSNSQERQIERKERREGRKVGKRKKGTKERKKQERRLKEGEARNTVAGENKTDRREQEI